MLIQKLLNLFPTVTFAILYFLNTPFGSDSKVLKQFDFGLNGVDLLLDFRNFGLRFRDTPGILAALFFEKCQATIRFFKFFKHVIHTLLQGGNGAGDAIIFDLQGGKFCLLAFHSVHALSEFAQGARDILTGKF